MADKNLEELLALMSEIATVVNKFASPAVQAEVLWILVMAADLDLEFIDCENPALCRKASKNGARGPWVERLNGLLGEDKLAEVYDRLKQAEVRAADPRFVERALEDSLDAEGLRDLAARVAEGEPVSLHQS